MRNRNTRVIQSSKDGQIQKPTIGDRLANAALGVIAAAAISQLVFPVACLFSIGPALCASVVWTKIWWVLSLVFVVLIGMVAFFRGADKAAELISELLETKQRDNRDDE